MQLQLLLLELRSIWRTKRMRQLLFLNGLMVPLVSANFVLNSSRIWTNVAGKAMIIALLAAGITAFAFSKDSAFYPALQSRPLSLLNYSRAKYRLAALFCFFSYVVVQIFDLLAGRQLWEFNFALFTISAGIILPLVILAAAYDRNRINTSRSAFFNYEGAAMGRQTLPTLPLLLFFFMPQFWMDWWFVLLAIGTTALLLQTKVIAKNAALLERRKYIMLEGFLQ